MGRKNWRFAGSVVTLTFRVPAYYTVTELNLAATSDFKNVGAHIERG